MSVGPTRGPYQRPSDDRDFTETFQRIGDLENFPPEIGLYDASIMGTMIGAAAIPNGLVIAKAVLYIPDRDGLPLLAGEDIVISFSQGEPTAHFSWMAARAHIVDTVDDSDFNYVHPWESNPWRGGIGNYAAPDPFPTFGGYQGFVAFAAVTNDDGEVVTWTLPDSSTMVEQYAFDDAGVGHVGYAFHDFGARDAGNVTAAFSGASTQRAGSLVWSTSPGAVTVGTMVGENQVAATSSEIAITLTSDIPAGSQVIIVSAVKGPTGYDPTDRGSRPQIFARAPASTNIVPKMRIKGQYYTLPGF